MERKFTDDEIVKALECCCDVDVDSCNKCPIYPHSLNMTQTECMETAMRNALDLINRQKEEIESLKEAYAIYEETTGLKLARAETIKEFAERLKQYCVPGGDFGDPCGVLTVTDRWIDYLVKEMTGENNGN